jgi:transcriptional regulator with GAF, ATPase, and Fis domain
MALSSRVEIKGCEIRVIHRLHLLNQGCSNERFAEVVREIRAALARTGHNRTAAAQLLGLTFRQLRYRMQRLGLR